MKGFTSTLPYLLFLVKHYNRQQWTNLIIIRDDLAADQQVDIEQLVEQAVEVLHTAKPAQPNSNCAALSLMAKKAEEVGFRIGRDDVSENFDDILHQLVAEDLRKRRDNGNAE